MSLNLSSPVLYTIFFVYFEQIKNSHIESAHFVEPVHVENRMRRNMQEIRKLKQIS